MTILKALHYFRLAANEIPKWIRHYSSVKVPITVFPSDSVTSIT